MLAAFLHKIDIASTFARIVQNCMKQYPKSSVVRSSTSVTNKDSISMSIFFVGAIIAYSLKNYRYEISVRKAVSSN